MDIGKVRKIVESGQMAKVDGCRVDTYSASAIVQVYDALSDRSRQIFAAMPVDKAADVAFKLIGRQRT